MSDQDRAFHEAVTAIDAGDIAVLRKLLAARPELAGERLNAPGAWLTDKVGDAVNGFFKKPYLLWFVAEDPVRNTRLPANIIDVARLIIDAAKVHAPATVQEQLDYCITLVAWSGIARERGVQIPLLDLLIDSGGVPGGNANNALVNRHREAAEQLIKRGGTLTLASAACLERWNDAERLMPAATTAERQFALVLAALNGNAAAVRWLADHRADVNEPSKDLYPHGRPLHHAVSAGSLASVRALVERGADVRAVDSAWGGTPLGWALHYLEQTPVPPGEYAAIAEYLRGLNR